MKKILIVNNDPDTLDLLRELLQLKGYHIKWNDTPDEVPEMLEDFKPNLILLDISRRVVLDQIKDAAKQQHVPVILMTGYNDYSFSQNDIIKLY